METKIYKIDKQTNNLGTEINKKLRLFFHNENQKYCGIYFLKTELTLFSEEEIAKNCETYKKLSTRLNIPMFVSRLNAQHVVDCGAAGVLTAGSFPIQKIDFLFLEREAIEKIGYFDERMTDNCCFGDFAYRLNDAGLYPKLSKNHLPWLFDIQRESQITGKCILEELSCGWYNYKYKQFPQNHTLDTVDNLKIALKEHTKKVSKNE